MPLSAGTRLGPYEILAPIGAGGMGEVYRARDSRLDRDVAIKVLPEQRANDPTALIRFEHEAKAVAALAHPNILVLYDVGLSDGTRYAVTELLEGQTLRERLSRGSLPWRKAAEVGAAVADGLAAAHAKEIVHRDIKPGNIFLTDDGRVKILDFGVARWQTKPAQQDSTVTLAETEAGQVVGTVGYMSPEQVRGQKPGASSDIFSLGIVLYEMVAGRHPFSRNSAAETMSAILDQDPPAIADSGAQAPPEVERIVERCLAKNTGERFHSARDLGFALRGLFAPPSGRSVSRRAWVAVAALIALIVGGGGLMYWRTRDAKSIESLAVLPFANMSGSPEADYLSDGLTDSLIDSLTELPSLKVMSHNAVVRYKGKDSDARAIGRKLGVRAVLTGRITQRGDNLAVSAELVDVDDNRALWGAQYNRKLADALAVQNEIAGQIVAKLRLRLTDQQKTRLVKRQTDNPEAYQLYLKGRYYVAQFTQGGLDKGLAYLHQATDADPNYSLAYGGLSYYYALLDEFYADPSEVRPKAREAAQKAVELDDNSAEAHTDLANALVFYHDWNGAEREFKRALELEPNYAPAHEWYGWFLPTQGRFDEGIGEMRRAKDLDPLSVEISSLLGWDLYFARRYDEAAAELRKCLELDPSFWAGYLYLGWVYEEQKRFDDAVATLQKARKLETAIPYPVEELAHAYALAGRAPEAKRALREATAYSGRGVYVLKYPLALTYAALGDNDRAFSELELSYKEGSLMLDFVKTDPALDSLRPDPRFQDLLRRMKLQ